MPPLILFGSEAAFPRIKKGLAAFYDLKEAIEVSGEGEERRKGKRKKEGKKEKKGRSPLLYTRRGGSIHNESNLAHSLSEKMLPHFF